MDGVVIEIGGTTDSYLTIAVYYHYFSPGRFKLQTRVYFLSPESFEVIFGNWQEPRPPGTRRWLPKEEAPYPGYCRAPLSSVCVPALCNCDKLNELWKRVHDTHAKIEKMRADEMKDEK